MYVFCYQRLLKQRERYRNRILYIYIYWLGFFFAVDCFILILLLTGTNSWCLHLLNQYFLRMVYPIIFARAISKDSYFWRTLLFSIESSSTYTDAEASKFRLRYIFGGKRRIQSMFDPLIDVFGMGIKMIDFTDLRYIFCIYY